MQKYIVKKMTDNKRKTYISIDNHLGFFVYFLFIALTFSMLFFFLI